MKLLKKELLNCSDMQERYFKGLFTPRLLKTTEFTETSEIEDNSSQLTDDDLNLRRSSFEEKFVSVDLNTLRTQI